MAYFRQATFDLWRSWVVSKSKRRTPPFRDHSAPHLIFMSTAKTANTNVCLTGKWAFLIPFIISIPFLIRLSLPLSAALRDQQWVNFAIEGSVLYYYKNTIKKKMRAYLDLFNAQ